MMVTEWLKINSEKRFARNNEHFGRKKNSDPSFRLSATIGSKLNQNCKKQNISDNKTTELLGCSYE